MKLYTIIGGVNGCGKSSLTGALKAERSDLGLLIDVDKLAAQLGSPVEGGKAAVRKIDECLEKGISFTQETTLSGARTERTIRRAKERGYTIRLYYIGLDTMEESLGRIANRVAKGGHDIPKADVERRFQSRFTDVLRVLPYCDEARFFDNDNGFVEVAEYRNGELIP
ncbi:MAG: zeta toxin family protein, partial [Acutalibacter sp.]